MFSELLQVRGHAGRINFDHKQRTVDLDVKLNAISGHASTVKDAKSMSGGERSYTTICYVLSIGAQLQTPFRLMGSSCRALDFSSSPILTPFPPLFFPLLCALA